MQCFFNSGDINLQFTSWLCFGDGRYSEALDNLEKKSEAPPSSSYNADEIQMSQKWFAVLTSYLRSKCAHMVRARAENKDGFRLWHSLNQEYMPSTGKGRWLLLRH